MTTGNTGSGLDDILNIPAGQSLIGHGLGYPCYGLVVDNITNQWYYEPLRRRWIAPYQGGVTVPLGGTQVASLICQAPTTAIQSTPIPGEYVTATWTMDPVVAGGGISVGPLGSGPPARPVFYGQQFPTGVPLAVSTVGYQANGAAPSFGVVTTITVPAGTVAYVESVHASIYRDAAPGVAGIVQAYARWKPPTLPPQIVCFVTIPATEAALNIGHTDSVTPLGYVGPGSVLDWVTTDTSTGGSCTFYLTMKYMFFAAP